MALFLPTIHEEASELDLFNALESIIEVQNIQLFTLSECLSSELFSRQCSLNEGLIDSIKNAIQKVSDFITGVIKKIRDFLFGKKDKPLPEKVKKKLDDMGKRAEAMGFVLSQSSMKKHKALVAVVPEYWKLVNKFKSLADRAADLKDDASKDVIDAMYEEKNSLTKEIADCREKLKDSTEKMSFDDDFDLVSIQSSEIQSMIKGLEQINDSLRGDNGVKDHKYISDAPNHALQYLHTGVMNCRMAISGLAHYIAMSSLSLANNIHSTAGVFAERHE